MRSAWHVGRWGSWGWVRGGVCLLWDQARVCLVGHAALRIGSTVHLGTFGASALGPSASAFYSRFPLGRQPLPASATERVRGWVGSPTVPALAGPVWGGLGALDCPWDVRSHGWGRLAECAVGGKGRRSAARKNWELKLLWIILAQAERPPPVLSNVLEPKWLRREHTGHT